MLEPRRIAAQLSALRVAENWANPLGQTVGVQLRFESIMRRRGALSPKGVAPAAGVGSTFYFRRSNWWCSMNFTNVTTRRTCCWRCLCGFSRTETAGLATVRNVRDVTTPPKSPVSGPVSAHRNKGKSFPVDGEYLPRYRRTVAKRFDGRSAIGAKESCRRKTTPPRRQGDILVFLPSSAEIRRLSGSARRAGTDLGSTSCHCSGDLSLAEQRQIGRRHAAPVRPVRVVCRRTLPKRR